MQQEIFSIEVDADDLKDGSRGLLRFIANLIVNIFSTLIFQVGHTCCVEASFKLKPNLIFYKMAFVVTLTSARNKANGISVHIQCFLKTLPLDSSRSLHFF